MPNITYEYEDDFGLDITFDIEYHIEDQGIGPYEYGSIRGHHTDPVPVIDTITINKATQHFEDGTSKPINKSSIQTKEYEHFIHQHLINKHNLHPTF